MCRFFALRSNCPTKVIGSLLSAPHSLQKQSSCDRRGECHDSGWGIGWYDFDTPRRIRSAQPAREDPQYVPLVDSIVAHTLVAHVRKASAGAVAERNSHPFIHGHWLFAHNGTLCGFEANPEPLRRLISPHLSRFIEGDTDSEHAFYLFLSRLEQTLGSLNNSANDAGVVSTVLGQTIRTLHELYPGSADEPSELNFVVTDGRILLASRWKHSLYCLKRLGRHPKSADCPIGEASNYLGIVIASEPTTEEAWSVVPDRTIVQVDADLTLRFVNIPAPPSGDTRPL